MIGVFCSLDLVVFYLFFEAGLIPMFLIIGIWGGERRVYSAFKFFLYTLLGSVLMLIAIISIYWITGTTDVTQIFEIKIPKEYKDVQLNPMLADNCAMQLLRNPKQFDVIVTDNLFGDMLSDQASMLTGSLGLLPSASLGAKNKDGKMRAMYEPIHGSAPDIAGKGIANPIATILSFAMALRFSLNLDKEADLLEKAVQDVLNDGLRTKDIASKGSKEVSTTQMGDAIISKLK